MRGTMRKLLILIIISLIIPQILCSYSISSYITELYYKSHEVESDRVRIECDFAQIEIHPYTPNMIAVRYHTDGVNEAPKSHSVIMEAQKVDFQVNDNENYLEITTDTISLRIHKSPVRISYLKNGKTFLKDTMSFYKSIYEVWVYQGVNLKLHDNEAIYGLGSKAVPINRVGMGYELYNRNRYGYVYGESTLNTNVPLILSSRMYGLYFDNYAQHFCIPGVEDSENILQYQTNNGKLAYFVFTGESYPDMINTYTMLTGRQPIPPRWSLGYLQSRVYYSTEDQVRQVMDTMRTEGFPIDGVIFDMSWFGSSNEVGNLSWDRESFPNPEDMMQDFKDMGIKTILIVEPYVSKKSHNYEECEANGYFAIDTTTGKPGVAEFIYAPVSLLDFFDENVQDWFWNKCKENLERGAEGLWHDCGEPDHHEADWKHKAGMALEVHNMYGMEWLGSQFKHFREEYPEKRPFLMNRAGWGGTQRYGAIPLCGDEYRSWEGLKAQIPVMLGMGMSGYGYIHSDAGGYAAVDVHEKEPELYTRWLQFGAFSPVFRVHLSGPVPSEPVFFPDTVRKYVRKIVKLRYNLLPYNYTLAWENSQTGMPLARPMNLYHPNDTAFANINDQYYWGDRFLAAPVMKPGQIQQEVLLPEGKWVDYWTDSTYGGGQKINVYAPVSRLPLFVKAGSIIPMAPDMLTTANYNYDSLIFEYYPDLSVPSSSISVYEDDGITFNPYDKGMFQFINAQTRYEPDTVRLRLTLEGPGYREAPDLKKIHFKIKNVPYQPGAVLLNQDSIDIVFTLDDFEKQEKSALYDRDKDIIHVHFNWTDRDSRLKVVLDSTATQVGVPSTSDNPNEHFIIHKIYPNPFDESINIKYEILNYGSYTIRISDYLGRTVKEFRLTGKPVGKHTLKWDGLNKNGGEVSPGNYIISVFGDNLKFQCQVFILKKAK